MEIKLVILFALVVTSNMLVAQSTSLSPDEFQKELTSSKVQLLDVRTAGEYQNTHIKNSLQADWVNFDQFKDRVQYLDKDEPIMIYCASGVRSGKAAVWLRENGYKDVRELRGGIVAWKANDKPTEGVAAVKQMTLPEYEDLYKTKNLVLIDFGAEWCPPCKSMEPVLNKLQENLKGKFTLVKVDGGIQSNIMKELKVEGIPTFIIYKNGTEIWRKQGVVDEQELKKQLGY